VLSFYFDEGYYITSLKVISPISIDVTMCLSVCHVRHVTVKYGSSLKMGDNQCENWPKRTGGSDVEMFEILPTD